MDVVFDSTIIDFAREGDIRTSVLQKIKYREEIKSTAFSLFRSELKSTISIGLKQVFYTIVY